MKAPRMNMHILKNIKKQIAALFLLMGLAMPVAHATDMPVAAGSPAAGITFDDRPLLLPVQRNFQMAMLTASSELGRSCGHMEAYGWRMAANEQDRVNQIFNNTVDRMRAQGFSVETKAPTSVSRDVTLFTADRPDKHMIFMWSAGEIGLVMVLCETSAPLTTRMSPAPILDLNTPQAFPETGNAVRNKSDSAQMDVKPKHDFKNFSPVGDWVGSYTCSQGTTGGTLHIGRLRADSFEGTFRFYPTPKNPYVPTGKYKVDGEYDRETQRILINPREWLQRPKDYYDTVMIGSFDPVAKTFSGYFQGINGCTSFEAKYSVDSAEIKEGHAGKKVKKHVKAKPAKAKKVKAKKVAKPEAVKIETAQPPAPSPEAPTPPVPPSADIKVGEPAAAPPAPPVPTPMAEPVVPPAPSMAPPSEPVPPPAPTPLPAAAPEATPAPPAPPEPAPAAAPAAPVATPAPAVPAAPAPEPTPAAPAAP